jgi:hypothetical protein
MAKDAPKARQVPPSRPLTLGEIFAQTTHLYGERIWAAGGIGLIAAAAFIVRAYVGDVAGIPVIAISITAAWAIAARVVIGESLGEAAAQAAVRSPALLVLAVVAAVPFAVALSQLFLVLVAVAWLALMGFSIPIAVVEQPPDDRFVHRVGFALHRSIDLARAEYLHAVGVVAALVMGVFVVGAFLYLSLRGFAENGDLAAGALTQVVLAPFFFLGLSVLYFDQRARALSSRRSD